MNLDLSRHRPRSGSPEHERLADDLVQFAPTRHFVGTQFLQPKVPVMDEAVSKLDEELSLPLRKELLLFRNELGFTPIYVTHDHAKVRDIGTQIVCMRK
jgi:ABC-type antimicrobial peptide transport system ATPase subunit